MKRINNKGFAISTIIYGTLIMAVMIVMILLSTMSFSNKSTKDMTKGIEKDLNKLMEEVTPEEPPEEPQTVSVAFDANGGSINAEAIKLTTGSTYGNLPTPTRAGYTFKGWNGKNMFNLSKATANAVAAISNNTVYFNASSVEGNAASYFALQAWNGTSFKRNLNTVALAPAYTGDLHMTFTNTENNYDHLEFILNTNKSDPRISFTMALELNTTYTFSFHVVESDKTIAKATVNNIMLEKNSTATKYEPYFITSSTTVVQSSNHNLKAIWE